MFGFSILLNDTFETAIPRVTSALEKEGFGILTEIDVQATLKTKLGIDRNPYTILGACNAFLANEALKAAPDVGLLLPCNVVVCQEDHDAITVAFMDPIAVLGLVNAPEVMALAAQARLRLERVRDRLRS
jgi:uncharacterized protein (DUF302 family)